MEEHQNPNIDNGGAGEQNPAGGNWYEAAGIQPELLTEKIRGFKDVNAFAKGFTEAQSFIGRGIPDDSTPADIRDAFYAKLGRPESADKYTWTAPESVSAAGVDAEKFKAFKEECFRLGMTDKQVSGVMGRWSGIVSDIVEAEARARKEIAEDAKRTLSADNEWGDKYDERLDAVLRRVDELGIRKELDDAGLLYDKRVLKAFDSVIGASRESTIRGADGKSVSPDERLAQLKANPAYYQAAHPDHAALIAEANEIYRQKAASL